MRVFLGLAVVAAALLGAGCSDSTPGQATGTTTTTSAAPTGSSPPATTGSTSSTSPMHGKTEFSEDELCDLLTTSESQQLGGGTTGTPTMNVVLEAPLCQWTDATSLNIVYSPKNGIKDLETGPTIKKSKIRIVGLDGVMSDNRKPGGLCQVGIDLTDHSSLVVGVGLLSAGEGKYDHCEVAKEMATIVFTKVK